MSFMITDDQLVKKYNKILNSISIKKNLIVNEFKKEKKIFKN